MNRKRLFFRRDNENEGKYFTTGLGLEERINKEWSLQLWESADLEVVIGSQEWLAWID